MSKNRSLFLSIIFLIFGFYCFICLILLPIGTILLRQSTGTWGDIFSLGQFLADLCLMPVAIVGFYLTLNELRKSQEKAELNIGWEASDNLGKAHSENRPTSANYFSPSIVLSNTGTAPSVHYQITLELPEKIGKAKMREMNWKGDRQGDYQRFIFTSAANWISFPKAPYLDLGRIEFTETTQLPNEITVKYYIASDKDNYKTGELTIKFTEDKSNEKS